MVLPQSYITKRITQDAFSEFREIQTGLLRYKIATFVNGTTILMLANKMVIG